MLLLNQRTHDEATDSAALPYDERKRSRLRVTLASGREAGIFLKRGDHLHGGDHLRADDGTVVEILAAPEKLIEATADSPLLFARAAYHLGNRHVPVQIVPNSEGGVLRFQTDHVLADMVKGLGCRVSETIAPFQPESGAYGAHGGHDPHGHDHAASADHEHDRHAHHHTTDTELDHHSEEHARLHNPGHGPHRSSPKIHEFGANTDVAKV